MNLQNLRSEFAQRYGESPEPVRLFFAPGRVNLIGEHTDYNGGFVLPCALHNGTCLLIRPNREPRIRLASVNQPVKEEIATGDFTRLGGDSWGNYPLAVLEQFNQLGIPAPGFDMLFAGDIPAGAGLSSSASIEMVTAMALRTLLGALQLTDLDLARLCQRAENQFIGVNCGIMDMFAIAMGRSDHALFINCHTLEHKRVPLILNKFRLIVANTMKSRGLAGSKYNERVAECQLAVTYISRITPVSKLGEISYMQFYKMQDQIPDEVIRRRARHVISENQRVLNAVACLHKGDLHQFGALMNASHESLRDNYEVTGPELDLLVSEAQKINGVIGARMTGAGFGGCTVNLVKEEIAGRFMEEVGKAYRERTGILPEFYPVTVSDGARELL